MSSVQSKFATLNERSREIFRKLVDAYIETGIPVGSRTIAKSLPVSLSPASVRNVMADLEDSGLIFAPHTSAGRIPTETGLRLFVDAFLETGPLASSERSKIDAHMANVDRDQSIESVLSDTTNLLSGLSHCAGVIVTPKHNVKIKHIEFIRIARASALAVLVGEDGSVENRALKIPADFPSSSLLAATNYFNARFHGCTIAEIEGFVSNELDTLKRELDDLTAKVVGLGIATWAGNAEGQPKNLIVRGQANLINDDAALEDLEKIRQLFDDFESKKEMVELLGRAQNGEGMRIFIGSENKLFSLSGSSLIVSPYHDAHEKVVGVLGVVGPTRLNYARIIPMVDYTAKIIGKLIT
jgi:heat-inducible transcriptional repressor